MSEFSPIAHAGVDIPAREIQAYGALRDLPVGLDANVRSASIASLNQVLADSITLRDLYQKHHWQVSGPTFYQLHLLLDKHRGEQADLVDELAERIMALGGVSLAMGPDVAKETRIPSPPRGREDAVTQLARLMQAHELILTYAHGAAGQAAQAGDDGTNDLLVSGIVRTGEAQVWFLGEHMASMVPAP